MKRFCFVILHYINIKDTIECIYSIKKNIKYENLKIVVVDNNSPNNTGKELSELFNYDDKVTVLENKKNLGFAQGNNVGFKYAKEKLKADFICLINNDTIIEQEDFIDICIDMYENKGYHIIGPDIVSLVDGYHQSPLREDTMEYKRLIKTFIVVISHLLINYAMLEDIIRKIKIYIKRVLDIKHKSNTRNCSDYNKPKEAVILHGACLIFSPKYVYRFSGICKDTFMYGEEEILFYLCKKLEFKYIYTPEIKIFHKEGSSTKTALDNTDYKKSRFYYSNKLKSTIVLLKIMIKSKNRQELENVIL